MPDETEPTAETAATPEATPATPDAAPAAALPSGYMLDPVTGQVRAMTFMERARQVAGQAAVATAKVSVQVGKETAKVAGAAGEKTAHAIRDPANQARARSALKKAKRGFTTVLERIDPKILADVVVKATSLQEKANASLKERNSAYRIGEITIGASFPPSIQFSIERVDDPDQLLHDSSILLAKAIEEREGNIGAAPADRRARRNRGRRGHPRRARGRGVAAVRPLGWQPTNLFARCRELGQQPSLTSDAASEIVRQGRCSAG